MSLQPAMPRLIAALIASVAGMAIAVSLELTATAVACAALFAIIVIAAASRTNSINRETRSPDEAIIVARRNTRLSALTYAWAALGMHVLYFTPLTGLRWQHGWQYGTAFALLAVGAFAYALFLGEARRPVLARSLARLVAPLTTAQAVLAACGITYLVASGKIFSARPDWAANVVFAFAAVAIMIVSAMALRSHMRLTRR